MTTHYEKIQALGNRMASNLETMGVSASFGDGGLTLADKILEIQHFTDGLLLWADKDIIQTGDTVNFCALLLEDKKAVSGETILFKGLETTQTLVANTETSVGNQYKFINLPTMTDFSQRVYLNEEQTIHITKGQQDTNYYIWIPGTPSGYFVPIDNDSDIIVENGVIKLKSNHSDWTYDASATNTNKITSTISDVTIAETMQGTTGSNGVATVGYTGKGAGVLNIKAITTEGIIQSEIYEVIDATIIDRAISTDYNDIWYNQQNTKAERKEEYTELTETAGTYFLYRLLTVNEFAKANNCIEVDVYQVDGSTTNSILLVQASNGNSLATIGLNSLRLNAGEWNHIKIEFDDTGVTFNETVRRNYTPTDTIRFGFLSNGDITTLRFKNFTLYPI